MELVYYPDPVLRRRAAPLESVGEDARERAAAMFEVMYREGGVGLAAPQVGWEARLFVMNPLGAEQRDGERVFVNPRIIGGKGSDVDEEGCLSIPDVRGNVERRETVEVEATDLAGEFFRASLEGLEARVVQHEYDHLDGILFVHRLSMSDRLAVKRQLKRLEKEYRKRQAAARR